MAFIEAYLSGWKETFRKKKLWLLLYALNIGFAILLAYPLVGFLEEKLGTTLAADVLFEQFDYAIVNDFMDQYGNSIWLVFNQTKAMLFVYLLFSAFLVGGILHVFRTRNEVFRLSNFWSACGRYFWRMLRLTIYFLIVQALLLLLFFTLFSSLTTGGLERFHNEGEIIQVGLIMLPFYLLFAMVFFMVQDYTKIHIVQEDKIILFKPIWQAIRLVFKNLPQTFLLYLINLLTFGLLFFMYWHIDFNSSVLFAFLLGQAFVLARIGTKLLNLASATVLYQRIKQ